MNSPTCSGPQVQSGSSEWLPLYQVCHYFTNLAWQVTSATCGARSQLRKTVDDNSLPAACTALFGTSKGEVLFLYVLYEECMLSSATEFLETSQQKQQ